MRAIAPSHFFIAAVGEDDVVVPWPLGPDPWSHSACTPSFNRKAINLDSLIPQSSSDNATTRFEITPFLGRPMLYEPQGANDRVGHARSGCCPFLPPLPSLQALPPPCSEVPEGSRLDPEMFRFSTCLVNTPALTLTGSLPSIVTRRSRTLTCNLMPSTSHANLVSIPTLRGWIPLLRPHQLLDLIMVLPLASPPHGRQTQSIILTRVARVCCCDARFTKRDRDTPTQLAGVY